MKIVLTGPKCSGKSKLGRVLADSLSLPFYETDLLIEGLFKTKNNSDLTCRAICAQHGEDFFRNLECDIIERVSKLDNCVISTGGSTMLNKDSRQLLRFNSVLILITATIETLLKRLLEKEIPAFLINKTAKDLFSIKASLVSEVIKPYADIVIDSSSLSFDETFDTLSKEITPFLISASLNNKDEIKSLNFDLSYLESLLKEHFGLSSSVSLQHPFIVTLKLEKGNFNAVLDSTATALLSKKGFVLIPTETVYGLACLWTDNVAKEIIYKAKARPETKPFQMLVSSVDMAMKYGCSLNPTALKIAAAFCPGPITIIVPSVDGVSKIGFRIPEHEFVLQLIKKLDAPLAATSANLSGEPAALNAKDALSSLRIKPSFSIDGGDLPKESLASTVVEIVGDELKIIRKGPISYDSLIKVLR